MAEKDYKEDYIEILRELEFINRKYEKHPFKANIYKKGLNALNNFGDKLTNSTQIINLPNISSAIISKLDEFIKTNKVRELERLREKYPESKLLIEEEKIHQKKKEVFLQIHGIGDAAAEKILELGITTIEELKKRKDEEIAGKGKKKLKLLNATQQKALKYYEETNERIPRAEIILYENLIKKEFSEFLKINNENPEDHIFEITGSFRRGKSESGDIDFLFTAYNNNKSIYDNFTKKLVEKNIIIEELTYGDKKKMVIAKLTPDSKARRVDLLYATPEERPFTLLYFTGSKEFNTSMRTLATEQKLTLNEHGFHKINNDKEKMEKITEPVFKTEKDIFDYLNMVYKEPHERINEKSVVLKNKEVKEEPKEQPKEQNKKDLPQPQPLPKPQDKKTLKLKLPKAKVETIKNYGKKHKKKELYENIEKFKEQGKSHLDFLTIQDLTNMLIEVNKIYYNESEESLLTDQEYDILREYILKKEPNNKYANEQHAALEVSKDKVKLPYELWSMDKIKPDTNALEKFKEKYKEPFVISAKLDGVSGLYTTIEDKPHLYTRGNGKYGQNIDHLIPLLKLPSSGKIAIRGELIIKEAVFKSKYSETYKNSRNFVSGLVNKKKLTKAEENIIKDLDFVAYEVIKPENLKPSEQLKFLETLKPDINIVKNEINITQKKLTNEFLSEKLKDYRANYKYTIDGIINIEDKVYPRVSKNPDHAFAFKMLIQENVVETVVVNVHYEASKDGYLKPTIEIEPMEVDGATITYITGNNAKYIINNKIGLGAKVLITRAGGVIPKIEEILEPAEKPILPKISKDEYEFNETNTDYVLKNPELNETVLLKNITGFFKTLEVEGLGEGNVKKLVKANHNTIGKILALTKEDIEAIDTFKDKMATKIHNSIKEKLNSSSLAKITAATNILGRGFAEKRINLILDKYPNILSKKVTTKEEKNELMLQVKSVEGLGEKTATQFVEELPNLQKFLNESKLLSHEKDKKSHKESPNKESPNKEEPKKEVKTNDGPLKNEVIVLSDFKGINKTKKEFATELTNLGATLEDNLTKKTTILIVGSKDIETGKIKKAKSQPNTKILTFEEFNKIYL
jgi:NAD-dependent DNA ligase/DNA polymerase/3'-5' exonuclease PolX